MKRLTVSMVYEAIKNSKSSLSRRGKKVLSDCIDLALDKLLEEEDDDSMEGDFEGIEEPTPEVKVCRSVVR